MEPIVKVLIDFLNSLSPKVVKILMEEAEKRERLES